VNRVRAASGFAAGVALLEISRAVNGEAFSGTSLLFRTAFAAAVLLAARWSRPARLPGGAWRVPRAGLVIGAAGAAAAAVAALTQGATAAVIAIAGLWSGTLAAAVRGRPGRRATTAARVILLAASAGTLPMIAVEIESQFAHEELFVAGEAVLLALSWLCLLAALRAGSAEAAGSDSGIRLDPRPLGLAAFLGGLLAFGAAVARYQASFFDPSPPGFPGVSDRAPFLCGRAAPDPETFEGRAVFEELLARVGANPRAGVAEDGMLALASTDRARAGAFRSRLLDEVARELFSRGGETKYWQFEASLRAYYYPRVRDAFPGLFSAEDERRVAAWFAAINRRALSPGLDDAIYALAFRKSPEGPYENQENGAGLLALLEAGGLAAPELAARNRAYLDRVRRGWETRFRNNDDSYGYQPEWIDNAYYQSLRSGRLPLDAARRSFEWLLLQAEPGGRPPDYNAAVPPMLPGSVYLGALLTRDPTLLWLAGRSVRAFERAALPVPAQPGAERALDATGVSPTAGSCLLFADSGLPNRVGPLAPDKVILRDGWSESSLYLLLNLRFSGWHRYRATNAIVRVVARGETLAEERGGDVNPLLPLERRLFRDKRIPRENLNALLVEPTGFAAALERLSGFGGPWAQDPPHFARVESFETGGDADASTTAVSGWRGWTHRRRAALSPGGPIVVVDDAEGPRGRRSALAWHLRGVPAGDRYRLGAAGEAELVLLSLGDRGDTVEISAAPPLRLDLLYRPAGPGRARVASVFLTGRWRGAGVRVRAEGREHALEITRGNEIRFVALP
jgi:hypothetical protein